MKGHEGRFFRNKNVHLVIVQVPFGDFSRSTFFYVKHTINSCIFKNVIISPIQNYLVLVLRIFVSPINFSMMRYTKLRMQISDIVKISRRENSTMSFSLLSKCYLINTIVFSSSFLTKLIPLWTIASERTPTMIIMQHHWQLFSLNDINKNMKQGKNCPRLIILAGNAGYWHNEMDSRSFPSRTKWRCLSSHLLCLFNYFCLSFFYTTCPNILFWLFVRNLITFF